MLYKNYDLLIEDIQAVVNGAKDQALVKVIIEACLLTNEEIKKACELAVQAGADFVKTSTGFSLHAAKLYEVELMRKIVGASFGVKASGGVRNIADINAMIQAGPNRIGTSSAIEIFSTNKEVNSVY